MTALNTFFKLFIKSISYCHIAQPVSSKNLKRRDTILMNNISSHLLIDIHKNSI